MKEEKPLGMMIHCVSHTIYRMLDKNIRDNVEEEPSRNNGWIIRYLVEHQGEDVFQRDLEREFSLRRSTISKAVDLMVKKGLIVRCSVESDARLKKLELTPKALQIDDKIKRGIDTFEAKIVQGFSAQELMQFKDYLQRVERNLDYDDNQE